MVDVLEKRYGAPLVLGPKGIWNVVMVPTGEVNIPGNKVHHGVLVSVSGVVEVCHCRAYWLLDRSVNHVASLKELMRGRKTVEAFVHDCFNPNEVVRVLGPYLGPYPEPVRQNPLFLRLRYLISDRSTGVPIFHVTRPLGREDLVDLVEEVRAGGWTMTDGGLRMDLPQERSWRTLMTERFTQATVPESYLPSSYRHSWGPF